MIFSFSGTNLSIIRLCIDLPKKELNNIILKLFWYKVLAFLCLVSIYDISIGFIDLINDYIIIVPCTHKIGPIKINM